MFRVILLLVFMCSCAPTRNVITPSKRDSLVVEIRPRDVVIRDTVYVDIPASSEVAIVRQDSSFLSNKYAESEARILPSGELFHTLKSLAQRVSAPRDIVVELRDSIVYRDRVETKVVEVERQLSWWQECQIKGFRLLLVLLVGGLFVRRLLG